MRQRTEARCQWEREYHRRRRLAGTQCFFQELYLGGGGGGGYKFRVITPEINTAGTPEESEARRQQEKECQWCRRVAESPV